MTIPTPKSDELKSKIPHPKAIQDMIASNFDMELEIEKIKRLVLNLHDSPISLTHHLTQWANNKN